LLWQHGIRTTLSREKREKCLEMGAERTALSVIT
jgi:hypothetical protein